MKKVKRRPHYRRPHIKIDGTEVSGTQVKGTEYNMEKTKETTTFGINTGFLKVERSIEKKTKENV